VVRALQDQAARLMFYSNYVYNDRRAAYSKALIEAAPSGITQVFFCNSGAEANETAMKIARRYTGKTNIIAMKDGFHGRTVAALSATDLGSYRDTFRPILDGYTFASFGDLAGIEALVDDDTAAVMLEPIQSMAGVRVADAAFYRGLRKLCDDNGIVLIFDEIQTGFGRAGAMFAGENWDMTPDLITTAKGIASGIPMGATLVSEPIAQTIAHGEQGSTFGGGPVACAAALATLEVIQSEGLVENARAMGAYIKETLDGVPGVQAVHGLGLLVGVELAVETKPVQAALLEAGILVGGSSDPRVFRLLPPLTIERGHVDTLAGALAAALQNM
jgi:acetylornithine aminotransferase/acetylornithine/N-succinyldiaminopimelate aminotransferase